ESAGRAGARDFTRRQEQLINQLVARQPEATAAYVWDAVIDREHACADCELGSIDKYPAFRYAGAPVARADTLRELAEQMAGWGRGIPAETVLRELQEYNTAAKAGKAH